MAGRAGRQGGGGNAGGEPVRLQVFIARAGLASRRAAEELIAHGRVFVNGEIVTAPGTKVVPGRDRVEVDGELVATVSETTWVALHKPKGYVTTRTDPYGRKTIYDLLPPRFHTLFHVGRLDRDSEGLLLLTNDGPTANRFLHPRFGATKEYLVDVLGHPTSEELRRLVAGVELEDGMARAESVERLHQTDVDAYRVRVVLKEGKKREVRRMMDAIGHPVRRLIRRRFGPVELGELPSGRWRIVAPAELRGVSRDDR
ncbi:MAG TPA: pseudouridine synthase [Longimicrobiaceae bacterium]